MSAAGWSQWHRAKDSWIYAPIPSTANGLYVIASRRSNRALYVGMSHTGRLRKTCIRHFQYWKQDWQHQEPRQTYSPDRVNVAWLVIEGDRKAVEAAEREAIVLLAPKDNLYIPTTPPPDEEPDDVAPF